MAGLEAQQMEPRRSDRQRIGEVVRTREPRPRNEQSGPKHGFARPVEPTPLDELLEGAPEISALEHAIRMAPAGWSFDSDDTDSKS